MSACIESKVFWFFSLEKTTLSSPLAGRPQNGEHRHEFVTGTHIMIQRRPFLASMAASLAVGRGAAGKPQVYDDPYISTPDFQPFDGPRGAFHASVFTTSRIYPGLRHWWGIYTPAQAFVSGPPALMVFQDGLEFTYANGPWRTQNVLDNLIAQKIIPPMVAVFVAAGKPLTGAGNFQSNLDQRSVEYDTLSPLYAEFLLTEILPLAAAHATWSDDPDMHAIGGQSSGAIAAFTVAWDHPEKFRKIYSANGSFTNIRGGNAYPGIVRAGPKRPLRIYMWSDTHDMSRPDWGDWATANKAMAAALKESGYDIRFDFGEGTHNPRFAAPRFPDAMHWLWRP
jgi:enterochelin esterase family protein